MASPGEPLRDTLSMAKRALHDHAEADTMRSHPLMTLSDRRPARYRTGSSLSRSGRRTSGTELVAGECHVAVRWRAWPRSARNSATSSIPAESDYPSGSVEDIAEEEARAAGVLLKGVLAAVRRAREIGLPTARILALLEPIPGGLLARLRAWALHEATDAPPEVLVAEITHTICDRDPAGDDVRLV